MVQGKRRDMWDHTSYLVCKIHNCNVTKESDLIQPYDVHPFYGLQVSDVSDEIELEKMASEIKNWS